MIGQLPHPTKAGEHSSYDLASMPLILAAWCHEYERLVVDGPARDYARERIVAILYSLEKRQIKHLADELETVAASLRDRSAA